MANENFKAEIKSEGIRQWEIANAMGVSEPTFTRLMRFELSPDKLAQVMAAVEKVRKGR